MQKALLTSVMGFVLMLLFGVGSAGAVQTLAPDLPFTENAFAQGADDCADGVIVDDGSVETGYGWIPSVVDGRYVQRFELSDFPSRKIDEICICWTRNDLDDDLSFRVQLFRDRGGQPALSPEASVEAFATRVPSFPESSFYSIDVSGAEMRTPTDVFYLGVQWDPAADQYFFLCADHSDGTAVVDGWFIDDRADEWTSVLETPDPIFANHRAMMIRARGAEGYFPLVPTLSEWGIVILVMVIAGMGAILLRRRET